MQTYIMSERNDEDDDHQDIVDSVSMPTADNRGTNKGCDMVPVSAKRPLELDIYMSLTLTLVFKV